MRLDSARDSGDPPARVAAIVPAFNEEETIADVIAALKATPLVDRIVVVSDGSTDGTADVAETLGTTVLRFAANRGKGHAMAAGVAATAAPILMFVDADILNLSEYRLEQLIDPVLTGRAAMNIGLRHRGLLNPIHRRFGPHLSGIRCLRREIFEAAPARFLAGYRIEVALNWACRALGLELETFVLYGLEHRVKEEKQGLAAGLVARYRMFRDVFLAWCALRFGGAAGTPEAAPGTDAPERLPPA